MKTTLLRYAVLAVLILVPFRYAFLEEHPTTIIWMFNFLAVVIGMLYFFYLSFKEAK